MTQYQATIQLSNGTLTVSRPHLAPQPVDDLVDTLMWAVRDDDSAISSVGVTIVTTDTDGAQPAAEPLPPEQPTPDQPQPDSQPTTDPEPLPETAPDDGGAPYPGKPPASSPLNG